jgi:cyclophilin family peptidyl-prolyl cis-trans isomerase
MKQRALTGVKPTGDPHLGNWLGAIRPALELARNFETFYFIADKFYPFGRVTEGTDVVDLIAEAGTVSGEPTEQIVIEDVRIEESPKGQ